MIHNKLFVQTVDSKYNNDNEIIFTSHFTGVPALVDNARPPEVTDNAGGQPPLDTDGVHALVELADPLPPTHPTVLGLAGCYHTLIQVYIKKLIITLIHYLKIRTSAVIHIVSVSLEMQHRFTIITSVRLKLVKRLDQRTDETGSQLFQTLWNCVYGHCEVVFI